MTAVCWSKTACCLMREAILRLDAVALMLRLLPIVWPLTVLVLLDRLRAGVVVGRLVAGTVWLGLGAAVELTFVLPALFFRVCEFRSFCTGGIFTSMIVGMGVFRLVFRWWMRGAARRMSGLVGLCEEDVEVSTL